MANLFDPEFDQTQEQEGFRTRRAMLGKQAEAKRLGASLFEIEPGNAAFPLHYHLGNEEMLIVVAGHPDAADRPTASASWPRARSSPSRSARQGAHQVVNRTDGPVRILMLSEMIAPDIVVRPESGKISAFGRPPGGHGEGMHGVYFERDSVPFWEGEEPPPSQ